MTEESIRALKISGDGIKKRNGERGQIGENGTQNIRIKGHNERE